MSNLKESVRDLVAGTVGILVLSIIFDSIRLDLRSIMDIVFIMFAFAMLLELFGVDNPITVGS